MWVVESLNVVSRSSVRYLIVLVVSNEGSIIYKTYRDIKMWGKSRLYLSKILTLVCCPV